MKTISFQFLLVLPVQLSLHIYLLDVMTAYLHGTLYSVSYLTPPPGFLNHVPKSKPHRFLGLRICKHKFGIIILCHFLIAQSFIHNTTLPYIFTYTTKSSLAILPVYVDDLNIIGTPYLC
jgi:hypothetical protein